MFAQTFNQPFEVVIVSSDGSPIDSNQQNSSHEMRLCIKSAVTVLIKPPLVTPLVAPDRPIESGLSNAEGHAIKHQPSTSAHSSPMVPLAVGCSKPFSGISTQNIKVEISDTTSEMNVSRTADQSTEFDNKSDCKYEKFVKMNVPQDPINDPSDSQDVIVIDSDDDDDDSLEIIHQNHADDESSIILNQADTTAKSTNSESSEVLEESSFSEANGFGGTNSVSCSQVALNVPHILPPLEIGKDKQSTEISQGTTSAITATGNESIGKQTDTINNQADSSQTPEAINSQQPGHGLNPLSRPSGPLEDEMVEATFAELKRIERLMVREKKVQTDPNCEGLILDYDGSRRVEVNKILVNKLEPHQIEGIKFLYNSTIGGVDRLREGDEGSGCILAHCMGKTIEVVTFLHTIFNDPIIKDHIKTVLVTAPKYSIQSWSWKISNWFRRNGINPFRFNVLYDASIESLLDCLDDWKDSKKVLMVSHEHMNELSVILNKTKGTKFDVRSVFRILFDPGPDMMVIGEGHKLDLEENRSRSSLWAVRTKRKIILTGALFRNNLDRYYQMIDMVKPRLLGSKLSFNLEFKEFIKYSTKGDCSDETRRLILQREAILSQLLSGCIQRFSFDEFKVQSKNIVEVALFISPTEIMSKMYKHFLDRFGKDSFRLDHAQHLRSFFNHPNIHYFQELREEEGDEIEEKYSGDTDEDTSELRSLFENWYKVFPSYLEWNKIFLSNKMMLLMRLMHRCVSVGDKLIIVSSSSVTLDLITRYLVNYESSFSDSQTQLERDGKNLSLHGIEFKDYETEEKDMDEYDDFIFCLNSESNELILDPNDGNRIVFVDNSWNLEDDLRVISRIFKHGQMKPVYVYRLVTKDTMEEKIFRKQISRPGIPCRMDSFLKSNGMNDLFSTRPKDEYQITIEDTPNPQSDPLLSDLVRYGNNEILECIEIDTLSEDKLGVGLSEIERKSAWTEFETRLDREMVRLKGIRPEVMPQPPAPGIQNLTSETKQREDLNQTPTKRPIDKNLETAKDQSPSKKTKKNWYTPIINSPNIIGASNPENNNQSGRIIFKETISEATSSEGMIHSESARNQIAKSYGEIANERIEKVKLDRIFNYKTQKWTSLYVNDTLVKYLEKHQIDGIKFLYSAIGGVKKLENHESGKSCVLAHYMGLGKTFTVIAFIHTLWSKSFFRKCIKTVLVIAPDDCLKHWVKEINKWIIEKNLKKFNVYDLDRQTPILSNFQRIDRWHLKGGLMLIGYNHFMTFRHSSSSSDSKDSKTDKLGRLYWYLIDPGPEIVIIDDAHKLRVATQFLGKGIKSIKTSRKIMLTGISFLDNLVEYHTMFEIMNPGLLGTERSFISQYQNAISAGRRADVTESAISEGGKKTKSLEQLLTGYIHVLNIETLQSYLNPFVDYVLFIRPSSKISQMYNHFLSHIGKGDRNKLLKSQSNYLQLLMCINHPAIYHHRDEKTIATQPLLADKWYEKFVESGQWDDIQLSYKFVFIFRMVFRCKIVGDKLIIVSQSADTLNLIERLIKHNNWSYFRIDNSFLANPKFEFLEKFNNPENLEFPILLSSTDVSESGISLTGANRIIFFDFLWDPRVNDRIISRIYRINQTKPVSVYHLVTKDTVEEHIFQTIHDERCARQNFTVRESNEFYETNPLDDYPPMKCNAPRDLFLDYVLKYSNEVLSCIEYGTNLEDTEPYAIELPLSQ